jgi:IS30 family transposase
MIFLKVVFMAQGRRNRLSAEQRADMWRRWQAGESLHEIGRAFGKGHGSIQFLLTQSRRDSSCGSSAFAANAHAGRAGRHLTRNCFRFVDSGDSQRVAAAASTVSREVARHGGRALYRANALRPKTCRLATHGKLRTIVASKLILDWSPEQISAWLKIRYPSNESMRVSHETIYRSLFIQARGVLKKELVQHLRSKRLIHRSRHSRADGQSRGQIVDAISIRQRPAEIEDRAMPGHWEGDLLAGTKSSHIATLVERHSRFTMLVKVPSDDTATVVAALSRHVRKLPASLRRSLTWDRGLEMVKHKSFTVATKVQVFFCDPQSPWQRGTNENTNGLLRQYFPKKTDLSGYSNPISTR